MSYYENSNPFSVCFNMMKIRFQDFDESLTKNNFLQPTDKVNVFINLETAFKNLSMVTDLEKKLLLQRDFDTIMTSDIINLAAHYKQFFLSNNMDVRIYIYNTDLQSDGFKQQKYIDEFRTYYLVKYNNNPKFIYLTDALKSTILPNVRSYCEFIPRVYYINSHNIEGSLVPYIIAQDDLSRKNLVVGGELYDSQYSSIPNFLNNMIYRWMGKCTIYTNTNEYLSKLVRKEKDEIQDVCDTFDGYPTYVTLLSALGDRVRSIDGLNGIGPLSLQKFLQNSISRAEIRKDTSNPNMLGEIFHDDKIREEFINNFYCTSIVDMYDELTEADKMAILSQRKDRLDMNSLQMLNSTKFYNHPLTLEVLSR